MRLFSLAFLIGVLLLQNFSYLPSQYWAGILILGSLPLLYWKTLRIIAASMLGFAWCLWFEHGQMSWTLPEDVEEKNIEITGHIISIPDTSAYASSFLFSTTKIQQQQIKTRIRLSWAKPQRTLHVGDKWRLTVRLKKIHGTLNPGSFDYEAWAVHEGIRAKGNIVNTTATQFLGNNWYIHPIDQVRDFLKIKIDKNLPQSSTSPWITALSLGERHGINEQHWEILRNTGTNHLMAIAGLHIGFMSGFAYAFFAWLWRLNAKLCLIISAQQIGAISALLVGILYSALAGFSIPTQRACMMLIVFLLITLLKRKTISWHAWSIALLMVLLINPLCVLTESFWLSFGAVALIIFGISGRIAPKGLWWKWGRIQWVVALGLIPFGIWLFQQCSIISFLANSIAIPWVGFLIVPLCLLGTLTLIISTKLGALILILADKLLSILWIILSWFAHLSWASWYQAIPAQWTLIAACIGIILLLLPNGFPGRFLGIIWMLPIIYASVPIPKSNELRLTLLDVGQGLSTVVQTAHHILVFDAGPSLGAMDMGESVVVPFLRNQGIKKIDRLIVSHGDNDHIGGAKAILKHFSVGSIKTSVPEKFSHPATLCLRNESWVWDNVTFQFLYPSTHYLNLGNDSSCVLRITQGNHHILLTGDIEKLAENYLLENDSQSLPADILIAPHHGSKTSGLVNFIETVHPKYVLFPIGYRNRYHFPHPSVVAKYDELKVKQFDTTSAGAIQFNILETQPIQDPILYRKEKQRYWND